LAGQRKTEDIELSQGTELSLGSRARSGGRWQAFAQAIEVGSSLALLVYLARIVEPHIFGTVSLAIAVTAVVTTTLCAPITGAVIAYRLETHRALSTAWWVAVVPSGLLALAIAGIIAAAGLRGSTLVVVVVFAVAIPLQSIATLLQAVLQLELRFRAVAIGRIIAAVIATLLAVILGVYGSGLAALVSRSVLPPVLISCIGLIQTRFWPRLVFDRVTCRSVAGYAFGVSGFSVLNTLNRYADNLLVGVFLGPAALGFYAVAYRFIETPLSQIGAVAQSVVFPTLVHIEDPQHFRDAFLRSQKLLVWIVAPMGVCSVGLGDVAVRIVLGHRWEEAGTIVQVFGVVALLQAATTQVGVIYMARNAAKLLLRWALISTPIIVGSFAVGLLAGIRGVAYAYLVANIILFYPMWEFPGRLVGLKCSMVLRSLRVELIWAFVTIILILGARIIVPITSTIDVIAFLAVGGIAYWGGALAFDSTLRDEAARLLINRREIL
jgi:PST family polysaccharide transporter